MVASQVVLRGDVDAAMMDFEEQQQTARMAACRPISPHLTFWDVLRNISAPISADEAEGEEERRTNLDHNPSQRISRCTTHTHLSIHIHNLTHLQPCSLQPEAEDLA
ncbi:hypothetical protein GGTG_07078 [Gaeumannomyces tritici R3-111a-1]|uniref:Uncharacterized protein n=1 Tax=Gaeumannomyces tritici (strain R3-111a-1) TaxID=644352 RepID=J3P0N3_GAET3|nr:hypothetical protein GGTG_07078 [Gaeumannomyces tritici R3-111a-1]EJT77166.1 hypothetical protein GGTG_07078 [Gaeumannomyces tritici R3-111a-1]